MLIDLKIHIEALNRLEKTMSQLSDVIVKLTDAVNGNTAATTITAANEADVNAAIPVIQSAVTQINANTAAISPAVPVTPVA